MIFPCVKHANTKIQIHTYTITAPDKVPERPSMWHIFEKRIVQGYQKLYSHVSNAQIQKYKYKIHKYTNTAYDKVPERPNILTPRIRDSSYYCSSVTEKPGLTHYLSNG